MKDKAALVTGGISGIGRATALAKLNEVIAYAKQQAKVVVVGRRIDEGEETDTPDNQSCYPQPSTQASGCGFPIAKIGVIFSLATGAEEVLCIDILNTHDIKLAKDLYQFLNPLDILLRDRAFCSYADLVFIKNKNCDAVFISLTRFSVPMILIPQYR